MNRPGVFLAGVLIAFTGLAATASVASAAESSAGSPLVVKVAPFDGARVKVAKRLRVVVSCTAECRARVRIKLITPAGNTTVKGGRDLTADRGWITGMVLTRYGVKVLRSHFRGSRLKVAVSARDLEGGTVRKKTRVFRFRR